MKKGLLGRRFLAGLLSVVLVLSGLCFGGISAFAEEEGNPSEGVVGYSLYLENYSIADITINGVSCKDESTGNYSIDGNVYSTEQGYNNWMIYAHVNDEVGIILNEELSSTYALWKGEMGTDAIFFIKSFEGNRFSFMAFEPDEDGIGRLLFFPYNQGTWEPSSPEVYLSPISFIDKGETWESFGTDYSLYLSTEGEDEKKISDYSTNLLNVEPNKNYKVSLKYDNGESIPFIAEFTANLESLDYSNGIVNEYTFNVRDGSLGFYNVNLYKDESDWSYNRVFSFLYYGQYVSTPICVDNLDEINDILVDGESILVEGKEDTAKYGDFEYSLAPYQGKSHVLTNEGQTIKIVPKDGYYISSVSKEQVNENGYYEEVPVVDFANSIDDSDNGYSFTAVSGIYNESDAVIIGISEKYEVPEGEISIDDTFPDKVLRNYVFEHFDTDKSHGLSADEISEAKVLSCVGDGNIYSPNRIKDLTGIHVLTSLETLNVMRNSISHFDFNEIPESVKHIEGAMNCDPAVSIPKDRLFDYNSGFSYQELRKKTILGEKGKEKYTAVAVSYSLDNLEGIDLKSKGRYDLSVSGSIIPVSELDAGYWFASYKSGEGSWSTGSALINSDNCFFGLDNYNYMGKGFITAYLVFKGELTEEQIIQKISENAESGAYFTLTDNEQNKNNFYFKGLSYQIDLEAIEKYTVDFSQFVEKEDLDRIVGYCEGQVAYRDLEEGYKGTLLPLRVDPREDFPHFTESLIAEYEVAQDYEGGLHTKVNVTFDSVTTLEECTDNLPEGLTEELNNIDRFSEVETVDDFKNCLKDDLGEDNEKELDNVYVFDADAWEVILAEGGWNKLKEFPSEGITISMPFPEGTDKDTVFSIVHVFTHEVNGHEAGYIETPEVIVKEDGIEFTVMGFSPIIIGTLKERSSEPSDPGSHSEPSNPSSEGKSETELPEVNVIPAPIIALPSRVTGITVIAASNAADTDSKVKGEEVLVSAKEDLEFEEELPVEDEKSENEEVEVMEEAVPEAAFEEKKDVIPGILIGGGAAAMAGVGLFLFRRFKITNME